MFNNSKTSKINRKIILTAGIDAAGKVFRNRDLGKELYRNGGKDFFTFSAVNLG